MVGGVRGVGRASGKMARKGGIHGDYAVRRARGGAATVTMMMVLLRMTEGQAVVWPGRS